MLLDAPISTIARQLREKEVSAVELVTEAFEQSVSLNRLHAFITVRDKNKLIQEAERADATLTKESPLLHGIPYTLKDAYITKDVTTTSASNVLKDFNPTYNSTINAQMQNAGAILIGKNNMDAWGHGGSNENTDFGTTKNPWNEEHIAGGSSGGSAVTIATRGSAFAIGEDTGGSIRNPSSMCNVCGLKVTYGRVSRYGAIAYASSLDTVGPMAKTVEDLAVVFEHMAGRDERDATSAHAPTDAYTTFLKKDIRGKVIGLAKEFFAEGLDPEVKKILEDAIVTLESQGAKIKEVSIPYLKYGVSLYYLTCLSETSSNLARYDGVRFGHGRDQFTEETQRRIMLGTYALSAGYADEMYTKAQRARTVLIQEFNAVMDECDVLLAPVTPSPAARIGELINDPLRSFLEDLYTGPVNLIGVPSLALPAGFTKDELPVGLQLIGKKFHEGELFSFGQAYQNVTDWHTRKPPCLKGSNE